mgnify:CR=1 FL=1
MKKLLQIPLLLVALFLTTIPIAAHDFEVDGIYYNIISSNSVEVTSGTSLYSGSVMIPSSVIYNRTRYSVTKIGDSAFNDCLELTSVSISNSVTEIGSFAFRECSGLTSIIIPNSVVRIGDSAFRFCDGLTSVTIPNSVTSIGEDTFFECYGLTEVAIPNSVMNIGDGAFRYCSSLTSITIPNSMAEIGYSTFEGCSGLTSVTIPNSVTEIGDYAFWGCSGLTSIIIPNSVTSIGEGAFYECFGLDKVTIGNSVTKIGSMAFSRCSNLERVNISDLSAWCKIEFEDVSAHPFNDDLQSVSHLYLNGKEIKDLVIPNDITQIKNYTFYNCRWLTSVAIPNSVTSIGVWAFYQCFGLTFVTIPNSVTEIDGAFERCSGLEAIVSLNSTPPTCTSRSFSDYYSPTLYVPKDSYAKYFIDEEWGKFPNIKKIEATATSISLDKSAITLDKATTETIYATIAPSNASVSVLLWTSDNPAVATVDRTGKVTAISAGTATITATTIDGSNVSASCIVTVNEVKTVVSISQTEANLPVNEIMTLTYTVTNSTNKTATWSTSDENIAYIKGNSSSGSVTIVGVAEGVATITATANDGSGASASCVVNVGVSGVDDIETNDNAKEEARYDIYGRLLSEPTKGINIIKMSDGSIRKEFVK